MRIHFKRKIFIKINLAVWKEAQILILVQVTVSELFQNDYAFGYLFTNFIHYFYKKFLNINFNSFEVFQMII